MSSEPDIELAGRYRLVRLLGRGGMGEVHEALDLETRRKVAVKRLRVERRMTDESAARFRREILATGQLSSKHVVTILDAGVDDATGEPFMVMEYLEGEDLGAIAERLGVMSIDAALRVVAQVCEGLAVAHASGIVHRDIKPSNLFVVAPNARGARIVKIVDFGIARIAVDHHAIAPSTELTQTGAIIGSPLYMAPEQLRGVKTLDHRADLWSLGVVAYRLLSGTLPHAGDSLADLLVTVCSVPAPSLRTRAPWIPRDLADLVHSALEIDVDRRIGSATAFAAGLRTWLPEGTTLPEAMVVAGPSGDFARIRPSHATIASASTLGSDSSTPSPARRVVAIEPSRPPRGHGRTLALAALLAGTVAVAIAVRPSSRDHGDANEPAPAPAPLVGEMAENLAHTPGAQWFALARSRCTSLELRAVLADTPPPRSPDGVAFATACAALAGDLGLAHEQLYSLAAGDRAYGAGAMFELAHEMADRRNNDPTVAEIMRMVIDVWPENYQALYAAGLVEFQQGDARAAAHLREFVRLHPGNDAFSQTAKRVLAVLDAGGHDCSHALTDPMGHAIAIPGC